MAAPSTQRTTVCLQLRTNLIFVILTVTACAAAMVPVRTPFHTIPMWWHQVGNSQARILPHLDLRVEEEEEEEEGLHSVDVQPARNKCGTPLPETTLAELASRGCKLLKGKVRVRHVLKLRVSSQAPASADVKLVRGNRQA